MTIPAKICFLLNFPNIENLTFFVMCLVVQNMKLYFLGRANAILLMKVSDTSRKFIFLMFLLKYQMFTIYISVSREV